MFLLFDLLMWTQMSSSAVEDHRSGRRPEERGPELKADVDQQVPHRGFSLVTGVMTSS